MSDQEKITENICLDCKRCMAAKREQPPINHKDKLMDEWCIYGRRGLGLQDNRRAKKQNYLNL